MMNQNPYGLEPNRPVLVYGLGGSGRAAVEKLADAGLTVWACDDNDTALPEDILARNNVQKRTPTSTDWQNIQALIKAPGIPMNTPLIAAAQAAGVPVLGEVDLFWRREKESGAIFIGITGTNGKSTTTALVAHILKDAGHKVAVGGNFGIPTLYLPEVGPGGFYVLELSSYQLENLQELAADGAVFLNLTPDHLERHGTMEHYRDVKLKLFQLAQPNATKVLGIDQPILAEIRASNGASTLGTLGQKATYSIQDKILYQAQEALLPLHDFNNLPGPHNAQNIGAAYALLVPRWLTPLQFAAGVKSFKGLPHRLEKVGALAGVRFINDSKATNGDSTVYALQSYNHIYWVCGGKPKTDGLGACLGALHNVRAAFTIGEAGKDFAATINAHNTPAFECKTLERAVAEAFAAARTERLEGAVVLLSPAAASYDQFRNFEHRGDVFANCVRGLTETLAETTAEKAPQ